MDLEVAYVVLVKPAAFPLLLPLLFPARSEALVQRI